MQKIRLLRMALPRLHSLSLAPLHTLPSQTLSPLPRSLFVKRTFSNGDYTKLTMPALSPTME